LLADYFGRQEAMSLRKATEWPWQLRAAEAWDALKDALIDLELFDVLYDDMHRADLASYWVPLRERGLDIETCYAEAVRLHESPRPRRVDRQLLYRLSLFLIENGGRRIAREMMEAAAAGSRDADFATAQGALAALLEGEGDFETALSVRRQVLTTHVRAFGSEDRATATACLNLAGTLLNLGRINEAEDMARRALTIDEHLLGGLSVEVAKDLVTLAECFRAGRRLADAETALRRALSIARSSLAPGDPWLVTILGNLAAALVTLQRPGEAVALAREAVDIERQVSGAHNPKLAVRLNNLAHALRATGEGKDAASAAQEALRILVAYSTHTGVAHRHLGSAATTFAEIATETGMPRALVVLLVNGILSPLQDAGIGTRPTPPPVPQPVSEDHVKRPQVDTPPSMATESEARETESEARATGAAVAHADILDALDPDNTRTRAWHGQADAQLRFAVMAESEGRFHEAGDWYRRAAQQGLAQAQFNLGVFLQNGHGGTTDLAEAITWYEKAAGQGYANAMYNLAFMREEGLGCRQDPRAAFALYERAAALNEPDSQCKLAILLMDEACRRRIDYPYRQGHAKRFAMWRRVASMFAHRSGDTGAAGGWNSIPVDNDRARTLLQEAARNGHQVSAGILRDLGWV
jgi:TPR repeat protein